MREKEYRSAIAAVAVDERSETVTVSLDREATNWWFGEVWRGCTALCDVLPTLLVIARHGGAARQARPASFSGLQFSRHPTGMGAWTEPRLCLTRAGSAQPSNSATILRLNRSPAFVPSLDEVASSRRLPVNILCRLAIPTITVRFSVVEPAFLAQSALRCRTRICKACLAYFVSPSPRYLYLIADTARALCPSTQNYCHGYAADVELGPCGRA